MPPVFRRPSRLTEAEAVRIIAQADAGSLDLTDPRIARIVGDAHRTVYRATLWGELDDARRRRTRRNTFIGGALFVAFCVLGLLLPLALSIVSN